MNYFRAKAELKFIIDFRNNVEKLWEIENVSSKAVRGNYFDHQEYNENVVLQASKDKKYQDIRTNVAKMINKAVRLADESGVAIHMKSYPPQAVGGPVISINLFEAILNNWGYSPIDSQTIDDAMNKLIGECQEKMEIGMKHLINPFYWVKDSIVFLLRLPYILLSTTGFNMKNIEESIWGKLSKLLILIVIIYILFKIGVNKDDLKQLVDIFT